MNFFSFDLRKLLMGLFLLAIPLVLLNVEHNPEDTAWYKRPFLGALGLIQTGYKGFIGTVEHTAKTYLYLIDLRKTAQEIEKKNRALLAHLQQVDELRLENNRLRRLLNFKENSPMELLPAQVIGQDISSDYYTLVINKGERHGVKKLQAVISTEGVVGYIFNPQPLTSQVLLITDRGANVDAVVQRTRARGIVSGRTATTARLRYLERADHVQPGDLVVTSGLQGFFPKGFPIGVVTAVRSTDQGISPEAQMDPIVSPQQLEEVLIVFDSRGAEFSEESLQRLRLEDVREELNLPENSSEILTENPVENPVENPAENPAEDLSEPTTRVDVSREESSLPRGTDEATELSEQAQ